MCLTALAELPVYLELFVVADKSATVPGLEPEVVTSYWKGKPHRPSFLAATDPDYEPPYMAGYIHTFDLYHPSAIDQLWNGCMVSKLTGTLKPRNMKKDLAISLTEGELFQAVRYSYAGAVKMGLWGALPLWILLMPVLVFGCHQRILFECDDRFFWTKLFLPAVAATGVVGVGIFLCLPKVAVLTGPGRGEYSIWHTPQLSWNPGIKLVDSQGLVHGKDATTVADRYRRYFAAHPSANEYTGERVREEDSPGNYQIIKTAEGTIFRAYSRNGRPYDIALHK